MKRWFMVLAAGVLSFTATRSAAPAQELFQPASSHDIVVSSNVGPTGTGLDFDWADVAGATGYRLTVRRGPMLFDQIETTVSHGLYTSIVNPLVPGNPGTPINYSWQVTALADGQPISTSVENFFGLVRGSSSTYPNEGPLPAPTGFHPTKRDRYTAGFVPSGLIMTWNPVPSAIGYEVQLVQTADAAGQGTNRLIYRLNCTRPMALVSNIATGAFRLDVRGIQSGGGRGMPGTSQFKIVAAHFDRNFDFLVDGSDLLILAKDWYRACRNLDADFIRDTIVDFNEIQAMKIVLSGYNAQFPSPRQTPPPLPSLAPAALTAPAADAVLVLNSENDMVEFDWEAVPDVQSWQVTLRNTDLGTIQRVDVADPNQTQVSVPASTFINPLGGSGNYTWSVTAKSPCHSDSESEIRPFTVQVNFTPTKDRTGAAPADSKTRLGWIERIGGFFLGYPAAASEFPEIKGATEEIPAPEVIFPFNRQCVPLGPRFDVAWTEVPDAEAYLVELRGRNQFGLVVFITIAGATYDPVTRLNRFVDPTPGDGIVQSRTQPTLGAVYTLRVAAVVNGVTGRFSPPRIFSLSSSCPPTPVFDFIDIDFNDDRKFDGKDLFAYAGAWYSATSEMHVDPRVDLIPDGDVDVLDLLQYRRLFKNRHLLPKSPPLDPPTPRAPEQGSDVLFAQTQANGGVFFNWIPPATTEEAIPFIFEVQINRPDGVSRVFAILNEFAFFPLTVDGLYRWRVRAISDDFTLGAWSNFIAFNGIQRTVEGETPVLVEPADGAVGFPGLLRFEWTNIEITRPDVCRFERIEIRNGDFVATFDAYHKASEAASPTVSILLPIFPNFGKEFTWKVTTYSEFTDSKNDVFQFPGQSSASRTFRIEGSNLQVSGIGAWNGDNTRDGTIDFRDYARLESGYRRGPNNLRAFEPEMDIDYNGLINHKDFIHTQEARIWPRVTLSNGNPSPTPAFPADPTGNNPHIFPALTAGRGVTLSWTPIGSNRYFVEWLDEKYNYHAYYSDRLPSPARIHPSFHQEIVVNSAADRIPFVWQTVPNAQEYSLNIQTVNPLTGASITVPAGDPTSPTMTHELTAGQLNSLLLRPNDGLYRFTVLPEACGHFVEFDFAYTEFFVRFPSKGFEPENLGGSKAIAKDLNIPTLFVPSIRIPATQKGQHFWRVTSMGDDYSFGNASKWQRFGIDNLGPAFE